MTLLAYVKGGLGTMWECVGYLNRPSSCDGRGVTFMY